MLLDPNERTNEKTCQLTKTSNQDTSEQVADSIRRPAGWASVMGIQTGYNAQSYDAGANLERTTQHDTWDQDYYILAKTEGL